MSDKYIHELKGGNLDLDLLPNPLVTWEQDRCPWNEADKSGIHKCAVKNVSMCDYFEGIRAPDTVLCSFPAKG